MWRMAGTLLWANSVTADYRSYLPLKWEQSHLDLGGFLMPASRSRKRLGNIALASLAVVSLGSVGFLLLKDNSAPAPPVSQKVQDYMTAPAYKVPDVPVAAFVGDSYTSGSGATFPGSRWTTRIAQDMGWYELNLGSPGAGYLNVGRGSGCPKDGCPSFSALAPKIVDARETDYVVVSGGRADSGQDKEAVRQAAASLFASVHAGLPNAKIIVISPIWDARTPPAELGKVGAVVQHEAEAVGAKYLELGGYFVGKPELIGPDGVHPTDDGYKLFAESLKTGVRDAAK